MLFLAPDVFGPPGGIARYGRLVLHALSQRGIDVHVVALMDRDGSPTKSVAQLPGVAYTPCAGSRPAFIRQAVRHALQARPGLILTSHVNLAPLALVLARSVGAKAVTTIHGIDAWSRLPWHRRISLQRSDRILAVSHFTANRAAEANLLEPSRLRVLHNCLDPQFNIASSTFLSHTNPSLLTVSRMSLAEQYKGHDMVIRAMPELVRRFPTLSCDIVGDGDARPGLETLAATLGVAHAVHFLGRISDAELLRCYTKASLFVLPSRAEGFGFVFLEAMAHGLPVIGGNMDATPEVVVHGETGLLVDPTSPAQITDAVAALLADPDQRQRMGAAAQRRVEEHFSFPRFQQQLLTILRELDGRVYASP